MLLFCVDTSVLFSVRVVSLASPLVSYIQLISFLTYVDVKLGFCRTGMALISKRPMPIFCG